MKSTIYVQMRQQQQQQRKLLLLLSNAVSNKITPHRRTYYSLRWSFSKCNIYERKKQQ